MDEWYVTDADDAEFGIYTSSPVQLTEARRQEWEEGKEAPLVSPYQFYFITDIPSGWQYENVSGNLQPTEISIEDSGNDTYIVMVSFQTLNAGKLKIYNENYSGEYIFENIP